MSSGCGLGLRFGGFDSLRKSAADRGFLGISVSRKTVGARVPVVSVRSGYRNIERTLLLELQACL